MSLTAGSSGRDAEAGSLGSGSAADDVAQLLTRHSSVMPMLVASSDRIANAVDVIVESLSGGGRLIYIGAGTSGWLAALDAAEVVTTFGERDRVSYVVGGGPLLDPVSMTLGDDDVASVVDDPRLSACQPGDVVIAVSASGSTPFTLAAVERTRASGARVIALTSRHPSALADMSDVVICVETGGEVVAGSTRLTAGFAQKAVLNTLSTVSMIRLGRAANGQMVCVEPLNEKLRARLLEAVAIATGADRETAARVLEVAGRGDVAVVSITAGVSVEDARGALHLHHGDIQRTVSHFRATRQDS